uniref:Cytochrome bc complex cytochrome b subunit n=1 Tax=Eiseniibacteriota bacterium TaxID=2212470 RepID=A0A832MM77_UNCEI
MSAAPDAGRAGWMEWLERRLALGELFSFLTHFGVVPVAVDPSRPLPDTLADLKTRPVPRLVAWPWVLGPLAAVLFALEVVTGVLLAYYYEPTPESAWTSVRTIVRDLPLGGLFHQLHVWGAYALTGVIALRLVRLFWDGAWRAPREVAWWSAVALAWLCLQSDFTGRLLVWDAESYWTVVRGMEVVFALPVVGPVLAFLLGGHTVSDDVLIRFYVLHLMVLPVAIAAGLYVTFATLRRLGPTPARGRAAPTTSWRDHLFAMTNLTLLAFAALVTLAVLAPWRFLEAADPYATPAGARPPWYMLAPWLLFDRLPMPAWIPGLVLLAIAFGVLLLPLWLRPKDAAGERRARAAGLALVGLWLALTVTGAVLGGR